MNTEKVKTFVARIVEECEQEGFTLDEALSVPQILRFKLNERAAEIRKSIDVSGAYIGGRPEESKHCRCSCGKEWHYEDAIFCTACGKKLEELPEKSTSN